MQRTSSWFVVALPCPSASLPRPKKQNLQRKSDVIWEVETLYEIMNCFLLSRPSLRWSCQCFPFSTHSRTSFSKVELHYLAGLLASCISTERHFWVKCAPQLCPQKGRHSNRRLSEHVSQPLYMFNTCWVSIEFVWAHASNLCKALWKNPLSALAFHCMCVSVTLASWFLRSKNYSEML